MRRRRARARRAPWRLGLRPALLGRLHCLRSRSPKQRTVPRQMRAPRTPGVRVVACRARVRARRPCPRRVRRAARGQAPVPPALVSASPGGRTAGYRGRPLSCTGRRATADAIEGSCGELQVRPAAHQIELSPTFPCTYSSSPTVPSPVHRAPIAGTAVAAATAAGRRCATSPALSLPQPSTRINPQGPRVVPRPRPAGPGRRRLAPRDPIASPQVSAGSKPRTNGRFVRNQKFQGPARKLLLK
jgi:hypothetical protein